MKDKIILVIPEKVHCKYCREVLEDGFANARVKHLKDARRITDAQTPVAHVFRVLESPLTDDPALSSVQFVCDIYKPVAIREETGLMPSSLIGTLELADILRAAGDNASAEETEAAAVFAALGAKK